MQSAVDNRTGTGYIKSLDGLRAVAVILVVFFHSPLPIFQLAFGWTGVNLFFILSGFLITRILLYSKSLPFPVYLKNFYARRILRIFPLYFFYLLIASLLLLLLNKMFSGSDIMVTQGITDLRNNYPFLLSYTYNFEEIINYLRGKSYTNSMFFGHLWTLSVEEQFYLLFPLLVYFLPVTLLKKILLVTIFLVPFLRLLAVSWLQAKVKDPFWTGSVLYNATLFQLDTLALGASLAIFDCRKWIQYGKYILCMLFLIMVVTGFIHLYILHQYAMPAEKSSFGFDVPVFHLLTRTPNEIINNRYFYSIPLLNLVFATLLLLCSSRKLWPAFFENKLLVKTGKISYGIYMYHLVFSYLWGLVLVKIPGTDLNGGNTFLQILWMALYLTLLYFIAALSYRYFERKFLGVKKRFGYEQ